jgi:hypothetical protein
MSAGKGDRPRAVNGEVNRSNFDSLFPEGGKHFDYPEGSKTKEQRISAMIYAEQMMKRERKPYPSWICDECGRLHGKRPEGNPYGATWHIDTCGICGTGGVEVTECRDFGHLREGWDE